MDKEIRKKWLNFLNPDKVRSHLIMTSIYVLSFEILKDSIIDRIRTFFCSGFNEDGDIVDPKYHEEVLNLNKSPLYASLEWLRNMRVIDAHDEDVFERVKRCRNALVHEFSHLTDGVVLPNDFEKNFKDMIALLRKIEVWWIVNVELATSPDYDGREVDEDGIIPGPLLSLQVLCDVALGDDEKSVFYFNRFKEET